MLDYTMIIPLRQTGIGTGWPMSGCRTAGIQ